MILTVDEFEMAVTANGTRAIHPLFQGEITEIMRRLDTFWAAHYLQQPLEMREAGHLRDLCQRFLQRRRPQPEGASAPTGSELDGVARLLATVVAFLRSPRPAPSPFDPPDPFPEPEDELPSPWKERVAQVRSHPGIRVVKACRMPTAGIADWIRSCYASIPSRERPLPAGGEGGTGASGLFAIIQQSQQVLESATPSVAASAIRDRLLADGFRLHDTHRNLPGSLLPMLTAHPAPICLIDGEVPSPFLRVWIRFPVAEAETVEFRMFDPQLGEYHFSSIPAACHFRDVLFGQEASGAERVTLLFSPPAGARPRLSPAAPTTEEPMASAEPPEEPRCPGCGGTRVRKYGSVKGQQRHLCMDPKCGTETFLEGVLRLPGVPCPACRQTKTSKIKSGAREQYRCRNKDCLLQYFTPGSSRRKGHKEPGAPCPGCNKTMTQKGGMVDGKQQYSCQNPECNRQFFTLGAKHKTPHHASEVACPTCKQTNTQKMGTRGGKQRYKCNNKACSRQTFSLDLP